MHAGRNLAILGAFRGAFRLSFPDAALLSDPEGILERQGPNSRHPDAVRFASEAEVARKAGAVRALLGQAMAQAAAGRRPPVPADEIDLPEELRDALDADPELAAAFRALSRGRRNSHALAVGGARSPATRIARIAHLRPHILAGKGATGR